MWIRSIKIRNYKGFNDSGIINLNKRFNIIVGKNNTGKTAFLESFRGWRHDSKPYRGRDISEINSGIGESEFTYGVVCSGTDMQDFLRKSGGEMHVPTAILHNATGFEDDATRYIDEFFTKEEINFEFSTRPRGSPNWSGSSFPSHGLFVPRGQANEVTGVVVLDPDNRVYRMKGILRNNNDNLIDFISQNIYDQIYVFRAERYNIGTSNIESTENLQPNASNLPSCLLRMTGNVVRFDRLNDHMSEIFPNVFRVVVVPKNSGVNIRVWISDPISEREDLLIPLEETGTGIGQVLSILYVAMMHNNAVIVIDEPNSFLHPGACKKLMEILKLYNNQYIIATHSPDIFRTFDNAKVLQVKTTENGSKVAEFEEVDVKTEKQILIDLGVSISDVFGTEKLIWVEGKTEEIAFDYISRKMKLMGHSGTTFLSVRSTGDFESRKLDRALIINIYEKISSGAVIFPPRVSFSFDREARSPREIEDLKRSSSGNIYFLPRRSIENFFLIESIIERLIEEQSLLYGINIINSSKLVAEAVGINADEKKTCDAPNLLKDLFNRVFEGKLEYSKIHHSIRLAELLVEQGGEDLDELVDYLKEMLT
ncbi:hypothetical protein ROS9278_04582 [Roseomonas sp. CECT 9278]|nr:hypothetical protein ROS9278_04582 [Roseomonas sp. CECT 9278]